MKIFGAALLAIALLTSGAYAFRVHQDHVRATNAVLQVAYVYKLTPEQKLEITSAYIEGGSICIDFIASDARGARAASRFIHLQKTHEIMTDVPFTYEKFCPNGRDVTLVAQEAANAIH